MKGYTVNRYIGKSIIVRKPITRGYHLSIGIIHQSSYDRRRCCSISGQRNVLISLTLELFTLGTRAPSYRLLFSMPQRCCVPGCINSDGGHRFPKDPAKKLKWRVAIKRLDPSTKRLWNPGQYDVVCFNHFASQDYRTTGILGYYLNSNVVFVYHIHFFAMVIYIIRGKGCIQS